MAFDEPVLSLEGIVILTDVDTDEEVEAAVIGNPSNYVTFYPFVFEDLNEEAMYSVTLLKNQ